MSAVTSTATATIGNQVPPGTIISKVEFTSNVTISATVEASATTVVTAATFVPDGFSQYWIGFYTGAVVPGTGVNFLVDLFLFDNGSSIGNIARTINPTAAGNLGTAVYVQIPLTPTAVPHAYSIRGIQAGANGTVTAGAGGSGAFRPGYISITKAA